VRASHDQLTPAGPSSPWIRRYLELKAPRGRGAVPDAAAVEGTGLLRASLAHGARIEAVLVCPELVESQHSLALVARLVGKGAIGLRVSPRTFARLTSRHGPDGVAAVARFALRDLGRRSHTDPSRVLVLDRFESPGNVGSLIRSASATGVAAVVLTERRAQPNHPAAIKASVGSVFSVPISISSERDALTWLRRCGFRIIGADPSERASYRDATYDDRSAVILGSERFGLSEFWRRASDALVSIPMLGQVDSLNAGHAGALILYEVAHQHHAFTRSAEPDE
jgi:TrmH family RNA methyltransferase